MSNENLRIAQSVTYDKVMKAVVLTLVDGSRHAWPIRLLEMVKNQPDAWVPLENFTEQQLANVIVYGGGQYIL